MDAHPDNDGPEPKGQGQPKEPPQWAFPTKSRCPGCGSTATLATCTKGQVQHRKCQACGHRYKVTGREV